MNSFVSDLKKAGYKIIHEHMENEERDLFIVGLKDHIETKFYVKFRKDYFNKFKDFFPNAEGKGDSINTNVFKKVLRLKTDVLVFVYPDQTCWAYPLLIKKYALSHELVRVQINPQKSTIKRFHGRTLNMKEETYCFPVSLLQNFKECWLE